jgi:hypothetical protein
MPIIMKTKVERTVYEISVEDLQEVAKEALERELTEDELTAVGNRVGDYIDWFQAIENAINDCIRRTDKASCHNPFASA